MLRDVLHRQCNGTTRDTDGWETVELAALPVERLRSGNNDSMTGRWEKSVRAFRRAICSMIPKPKAKTEAELRPIGILPCTHRASTDIRSSPNPADGRCNGAARSTPTGPSRRALAASDHNLMTPPCRVNERPSLLDHVADLVVGEPANTRGGGRTVPCRVTRCEAMPHPGRRLTTHTMLYLHSLFMH